MAEPGDAIKRAAEALSDLNTFAIVATILEGGHLHAPSYDAAQKIIRICHAEEQKRLGDYDRAALAALTEIRQADRGDGRG